MKLNFRKIASVLASAVMIGSTVGTAIAATYPSPLVSGGTADAAIVVTSGSHLGASTDLFAALDLQQSLQGLVTSSTGSVAGSVTGEASPLFTGSSKVYYNDSLNSVKTIVTKTDLPTTLVDGSFSGNVDATYTQTVTLGSNPQFTYAKMPTSSDDPVYGLQTSTTNANYIYNATVTFNRGVNFTHADSKNQDLTLFGQKYTVGSATDATNLILLKESTKIDFDSSGQTSADVTISGTEYTIELISASTSAATVKVTNKATGTSDSKEVNEGYSKKVNGVTLAVNTADSNNLKYTASVVAGSEKVTLTSGSSVTTGDDATVIDGTKVVFDTSPTNSTSKLTFSVAAPNSDNDAIAPGTAFVDPIFGSFKLDFSGVNVPEDSTARETLLVSPSGDDKMNVKFTDYHGVEKSIQYVYNASGAYNLHHDTDGHQIHIVEAESANKSDYIVVGNENEGHLLQVYQIINQTSGYNNDKVIFIDVFTGDQHTTTLTGEGAGTLTLDKVYSVTYLGSSDLAEEARTVRLDYPDSTNDIILYPTIKTSKGAMVFFYKPLTVNVNLWDGTNSLTGDNIKLPTFANGYQDVAVVNSFFNNISIGGQLLGNATNNITVAISGTNLIYNFTWVTGNVTTVYLIDPEANANIINPAIVIMEEKDDNSQYHGMIVTMEGAGTSSAGVGVNDVIRTYSPLSQPFTTLASDSKKEKLTDLWGSIALIDSGDSDQKIATISYPDEQIYAQLYMAASGASIIPGQASGTGGVISVVKDSEVSTVSGKNLVVVGGSCINSVAAALLGVTYPKCGADFTAATNVDAGKYILKSFTSPYNANKVAILVAGYEAAQTKDAVAVLKEGSVDTAVGTVKVGPTVA